MNFEWDDDKREANKAKHGVDFHAVEEFDWDSAVVRRDDRFEYGEARFVALGVIGPRLHVLAFTRRASAIRVIGLRRANKREERAYHAS